MSNTCQGQVDIGAPQQRKEICGSKEGMEHTVSRAITEAQEAKLWRRIDLRLMPMVSLMYLFSFMDRGNIGNAKLDGLMTQLNLTGNKYNIALTIYFILSHFILAFWFTHDERIVQPHSLFEFPSNLVIQVIRPSRDHGECMLSFTRAQSSLQCQVIWGLVMMFMGFVKTYPQLVGVRVCLGVAEAGFFPGVAYYLTMWYPKYMYQYRLALFFGAAGLAGAFSGLLAYAVNHMNDLGGLEGWSWIFILEGVMTILVGLIATFAMVDYPSTAKFLTAEERSFVIEKQGRDEPQDEGHTMSQQVWAAFTDWQVWALAVVQASVAVPLFGITYFLPTIVNNFGYSASLSQLLTVPPYAIATVTILVFAHFPDKVKLRWPFIIAGQSIALLGYIINISNAPSHIKYFGMYLCVIGSYSSTPGAISWLANNLQGKYKRAVGMALQLGVANLGGAAACNIFRSQDSPRYLLGHGLEIMFITIGLMAIPIIVFTYRRMNAQLDREELLEKRQDQDAESKEEGWASSTSSRAPGFRYTI
ncbi:MFS nicotinic acid transporter Tna1 [Paxillus ammoniavirescens]|nr:MFS nicotinic acid transporter Tna1 [Paxillus ammoniavirescens]